MSKYFYFKASTKSTNYNINKGNVKLVNEGIDYSIKYPSKMEGDIKINQVNENINIQITKDFQNEDPITINLNQIETCNINLESGTLISEAKCPNMKVKVNTGTLFARILKCDLLTVKADVHNGILNNNSDLELVPSHNNKSFGNFFGMNNMGIGFNNHVELIGNGSHYATFEVDSGTMNLFSLLADL